MISIKSKLLETVHPNVRHGFFGRKGGVSEGIYAGLNVGVGSDDNLDHVQQNRNIVARDMGVDEAHLITVWQVHSAVCLVIDAPVMTGKDRPQADGLVTDKAGLALGALSADCTPLLFVGKKADGAPVIGAAHSGWGGSLKGIGEAVIDKMLSIGTQLDSIHVGIGPCIAKESYEVSTNFKDPFLARDAWAQDYFTPSTNQGHLMFDMAGYIAHRLRLKGVKHIENTGQDTYALEDKYYSYRRKTHKSEPDYGRQISCIKIKS